MADCGSGEFEGLCPSKKIPPFPLKERGLRGEVDG